MKQKKSIRDGPSDTTLRKIVEGLLDRRPKIDLDPLVSTHIISPGFTHLANLTETTRAGGRGRAIAMTYQPWSDWIAEVVNVFPELARQYLALADAAKREQEHRDELKRIVQEACDSGRIKVGGKGDL